MYVNLFIVRHKLAGVRINTNCYIPNTATKLFNKWLASPHYQNADWFLIIL